MESTLEVRWFYEGDVPEAVAAWFAQFEPGQDPPRTDVYLHAQDAPGLNVKVRKGSVQAKRRIGGGRAVHFGPRATGRAERWDKFTFPVSKNSARMQRYREVAVWVRVEKERYQRVFRPGAFAEAAPASAPGGTAHAELELTCVTVEEQRWWTLCLEAEGAPKALDGVLRAASQAVFCGEDAPALELSRSFGYAGWLGQLQPAMSASMSALAHEER